jgi:adenosylhomocysteine nucleosidase
MMPKGRDIDCNLASVGFVTGLVAEARLARRLGPAEAGGGRQAGAAAAAERLIAAGATAVVSFGLCGGLDPALSPGALVVPRRVLDADTAYEADSGLTTVLGGVSAAALIAAEATVATASAKQTLFIRTNAAAVDIESGAVARVAARHGMPFAALRAVCDSASLDLPPLALLPLDGAGRLRPWSIAGSMLQHPAQLGAVLRLARAAAAARAALIRRVSDIRRIAGSSGGGTMT